MNTAKLMTSALFLMTLILVPNAQAAKPKYGPEATLLSKSHEYVAKHAAPDFWAMSPYYTAQQTGSACSIASVTMVVNAARSGQPLTADDELATQNSVLKKTANEAWTKAVGDHGGGVTLDQLGPDTEQALKAYGFADAHADVVHVDDLSVKTKAALHSALVANEKSTKDFIILNFIQGAFTGDADVGHIAPLAAFDAQGKRALVMDPDRDWYEPYWVSEETLLKGMNTADKTSGKNRGYVWVHLTR
jgi:hypothetical protein